MEHSKEFSQVIQVLIIEDDVRVAEINRRFVEKVDGYQVIGIATDEPQAKEHLAILHPDLVILDVYFPEMNGLDLLKYIKQLHSDTDVIMITAAKEINAVKTAIRNGVFDFIVKPVIFERFHETLSKYKAFRTKLQKFLLEQQSVTQDDIDELRRSIESRTTLKSGSQFPKGIDRLTLENVLAVINQANEGLTAEQVSQRIGCSRTTARRYLEYLVSRGEVSANVSYGIVGRPERVYRRATTHV